MTKALEPKDLLPSNPTFRLAATGKEHELRKINVQDYAWMTEKISNLDQKLSQGQMELGLLCKLLFRLLVDKSDFLPIVEKDVFDDDGELIEERRITGPERLAQAISMGELEAVTEAFNKAMGLKQVEVETVAKDKKKEA